MEKFRLQEKAKALYKYTCIYVVPEIPKVHGSYRNRLDNYLITINENICRANLSAGSIRKKYQKEVLVDIMMVDMILGYLYELKCFNKKKFMVISNMLLELRKMMMGWTNEES